MSLMPSRTRKVVDNEFVTHDEFITRDTVYTRISSSNQRKLFDLFLNFQHLLIAVFSFVLSPVF